jgi:signal transduction histidine kinase
LRIETAVAALQCACDPLRIEQVLNNLISNAIKYSSSEQPILIRIGVRGSEVQVAVQDSGIGISLEQQKFIFDRFYRVRDSAANQIDGLGIGLYISKKIIEQHGGRMWLESQPNLGSTFYFAIPSTVTTTTTSE